jgi:hypothetical protein
MKAVSVGTILNNTTKVSVYKVPTGYSAKWNLCYVVNHSGNNKVIDVIWYDASKNTEFYVLDHYLLSPTQFVKFDGGAFVVLEEGDEIRAQADSAATFHMINTLELTRNT